MQQQLRVEHATEAADIADDASPIFPQGKLRNTSSREKPVRSVTTLEPKYLTV